MTTKQIVLRAAQLVNLDIEGGLDETYRHPDVEQFGNIVLNASRDEVVMLARTLQRIAAALGTELSKRAGSRVSLNPLLDVKDLHGNDRGPQLELCVGEARRVI